MPLHVWLSPAVSAALQRDILRSIRSTDFTGHVRGQARNERLQP